MYRDNNAIDPRFFNFVSQVAHCAATYAITFTLYALWGFEAWFIGCALVIFYAAWHEFWYDPRYENLATRGSDLEDFLFLVSGPIIAFLIGHFGVHFH
jgi:hypothetical protein